MNDAAPSMEPTLTQEGLNELTAPGSAAEDGEAAALLPFAFARRFSIVITGAPLPGNKEES